MTSNFKGYIGELEVTLSLARHGYHVFRPINDYCAIDLIAVNEAGNTARVQVKHRHADATGKVSVELYSIVNGVQIPINRDMVDAYAIFCPEVNQTMFVSMKMINPDRRSFSFRILPGKGPNTGILYTNYLDPSVIFA